MAKTKNKQGNQYKTITFAVGYNKPYNEFEVEFGNLKLFTNLPEHERSLAMKEAHEAATNGNTIRATKGSESAK